MNGILLNPLTGQPEGRDDLKSALKHAAFLHSIGDMEAYEYQMKKVRPKGGIIARYGAGVTRTGINTANTAYFNLLGGTGGRLGIVEIIVNIGVAPSTAPALYLSRSTARGTQSSTLAGQAFDGGDVAAVGTLDVCGTGGSAPTFSTTNLISVGGLAVTAGGTFIWTFYDSPLIVPATSANGMVVGNANASGATTGNWYCSFRWDE